MGRMTPAEIEKATHLSKDLGWGVDRIAASMGRTGAGIYLMLKREGVLKKGARCGNRFRLWSPTARNSRSAALHGKIQREANNFAQPTIISFLPESPELQRAWEVELARLSEERTTRQRAMVWR